MDATSAHLTFQPCCYPRAAFTCREILEHGTWPSIPDPIAISGLVSIFQSSLQKKGGRFRLTLNFETSTGHVSCSPFSGNHLQLVCRFPWQVEMKPSDLSTRRDRNVWGDVLSGFGLFLLFGLPLLMTLVALVPDGLGAWSLGALLPDSSGFHPLRQP